jgi:hypothetical protein
MVGPVTSLLWILMACGGQTGDPPEATSCNGADHLCTRKVNEVAFLRAHNSHASDERGYNAWSRNHWYAIPTQLKDGVRALNIDVYEEDGAILLCHGFCDLGSQPLDDALTEISTFLIDNPREVVILDFQDEAPEGVLIGALAAHPLSDLAFAYSGGRWPTLGDLIDAGTPLILMGGPAQGDPAWFNAESDIKYATHWQYDTADQLECVPTSDPIQHGLYEVTHILTNPIASVDNAQAINHEPLIGDHINRCVDEVAFVNMLSIDYYSIGDGQAVVDGLNAP